MARVVSASAVTKGLEKHGWRQAESADGSLVVCKGKSRITIALHPSRPDMVYLFDLLERLPEVPDDLSQAAVDETLQEIAGFMLLVDGGDADDDHVQSILVALSTLNLAMGGCGLHFEEIRPQTLNTATTTPTPADIRHIRATPCLDSSSDGPRIHTAWRTTIGFIAEQAMPTVDRRRRTIIRELLDSVDAPKDTRDVAKAKQAVADAAQTLLHNNGRLRYLSAPLLRELDPGPRAADAAERHRAYRGLKDTGNLPALSNTVTQILEAASRVLAGTADPAWLVQTIEQDPAVTAKIIYRATRADVPVSREAKDRMTATQATRLLGAQKIRSIALGCDLVSRHDHGPCRAFDYGLFWQECTARATAARAITAAAGRDDVTPEEAYTAGLLCQIGRLALATALPKPYAAIIRDAGDRPARLLRLEFQRLKLDHHEVAAEMMADWAMPNLREAVLHQESPEMVRTGRERTLAMILQWTGLVWEIVRHDGGKVERAVLQSAIERALDLGIGSWGFADEFDKIITAWHEEADLFEVTPMKVAPWERIVEAAC